MGRIGTSDFAYSPTWADEKKGTIIPELGCVYCHEVMLVPITVIKYIARGKQKAPHSCEASGRVAWNPVAENRRVRPEGRVPVPKSRLRPIDGVLPGSHRWRKIRTRILQRDNHTCFYCGAPATTVDHVIAQVNGGLSDEGNLVAACQRCNASKGARAKPKAARDRTGFLGATGVPRFVSSTTFSPRTPSKYPES